MKDWKLLVAVNVLMFIAMYVVFDVLTAYAFVLLMLYEYFSCYYGEVIQLAIEDSASGDVYTIKLDGNTYRTYKRYRRSYNNGFSKWADW